MVALLFLVILLLNKYGKLTTSKLLIATLIPIISVAAALLAFGKDPFGIWSVMVTSALLAFFLFNYKERSHVLISLAVNVICVLVLTFFTNIYPLSPVLNLSPRVNELLNLVSPVIFFALNLALVYAIYMDSARAEERADNLLLNILPEPIADRLKAGETPIADQHDGVTILFIDIVGFTPLSSKLAPRELVTLLDEVFKRFDEIVDYYGLEKIKTIGDAYMAVVGAPGARKDHIRAGADAALALRDIIKGLGDGIDVRIGIHTGPVVAGVIGRRKFIYDLWGDSVNTASRMESHGEPGKIHVSRRVRDELGGGYLFEPRGLVDIKGKGKMETFFLISSQS